MILLLASLALAQEPQVFDPIPYDAKIDGKTYAGILVDEATFTELGTLRVAVKSQDGELLAFEEWKARQDEIFTTSMGLMKTTCEEGQQSLVTHYEDSLKAERKKDWFQSHAFPVGVAAGLVGATAIYLGAVHLYGDAIQL